MAAKTGKKKKANSNKVNMIAILVILLMVVGLMFSQTIRLQQRSASYQAQIDALQDELKEAEAENSDLQEESVYVQTLQYVEKMARDLLGMIMPDEILVTPSE